MANNKVTFFFSDQVYGWSEVYYDTAVDDTLPATLGFAVTLMQARTAMLAQGPGDCGAGACNFPVPKWIRVSKVGSPRQAIFASPNGDIQNAAAGGAAVRWNVGPSGTGPVGSLAPDNPYSGILCTFTTTNNYKSRRVISGVPDSEICDGRYTPSGQWATAFKKFASMLVNGGWGALVTNGKLLPNGQLPPNAIALASQLATVPGITQNANGSLQLTPSTVLSQGFFPDGACGNYRIALLCEKSNPCHESLNGVYRVSPVFNQQGFVTSLTTMQTFKPISVFFPGYIVPYAPVVDRFTSVTVERPDKRDRGRPFDAPRGRARSRR